MMRSNRRWRPPAEPSWFPLGLGQSFEVAASVRDSLHSTLLRAPLLPKNFSCLRADRGIPPFVYRPPKEVNAYAFIAMVSSSFTGHRVSVRGCRRAIAG